MARGIAVAALGAVLTVTLVGCAVVRPRQTVPEPIIPVAVWWAVDQEIVIYSQDAQYAAEAYARGAMAQWMGLVRTRIEGEFIPWYTSFWTQQWLAVKVGWYELNSSEGSPNAADRLSRYLQQEFYERVLEPVAETTDPYRVMQNSALRYVDYLKTALDSVRSRHHLSAKAFNKHLENIPAITVQGAARGSASLYQLIQAGDINRLPAYTTLVTRVGQSGEETTPGSMESRFYAVSKRSADALMDDIALTGGGSATALVVGGFPGILVSVAVSGWQAMEHEADRSALESNLRANLDVVLNEMWQQLMEDPQRGVMGPVNHMAASINRQ